MRGRGGHGGHGGHGGGHNNPHNGGKPRHQMSPRSQTFDSNGPGGRIRGNAYQVYERYLALARDAHSSGDRITAENFFQHAEHYFRIIAASNEGQFRPNPNGGQPVQQPNGNVAPQTAEGGAAPPPPGTQDQPHVAASEGEATYDDSEPYPNT
jgi:hypothetical protein